MAQQFNTLILGASYGSLLGCKLALAGHSATLVCTPPTAKLINSSGTTVRFPVRGRDDLVVVKSSETKGTIKGASPAEIDVSEYDLVVFGMQEPQYQNAEVKTLMKKIALSKLPCMAIMNMPPHAYIKRLPGVDAASVVDCYADASVWDHFEPGLVTLSSPDPQAFRPQDADKNVLQVSLPTNFKTAIFENDQHTAMLRQIENDIIAVRFPVEDGETELPVKVKVHDSLYVPLAKWSMLMTGNYRCVQQDGMISIRDAVHNDLDASREIYEWTAKLCVALGADENDLVPFDKYAKAASGLSQPSSAAKALAAGKPAIERVDKLVQLLALQKNMQNPAVDAIVENVQWYLDQNNNTLDRKPA